ncbi:HalOD1 output domain-containing protein [Haloarcula pelagica]|uniref:HalOD1 output domain-containing protein n=1 Tax=Haloarcula pelagica TaxID=3033389 RepID=UPI0024C2A287|nr:HalOD1 output domain-containing protein [Halomicroarcula sp. YJ-61-S]
MVSQPRHVRDKRPLTESHSDGHEPVPHHVVRTVAAVDGVPVDALPPLNDAVDTDALASLFDGESAVEHLAFSYRGYRIVVTDERVTVYER